MLGATAVAIIGGSHEVEDGPAVSVFAASLPDARLTPVSLALEAHARRRRDHGWPELDHDPRTLVLLADPFSFPVDGFLAAELGEVRRRGLQVIGGAASAARGPGGNRLVLGDRVDADAARSGVFMDGVDVRTVVSQGCRPVGQPYVVTRASGTGSRSSPGKPRSSGSRTCASEASDEDRALIRAGLHLGVVVDEHRTEFGRGDFLVRNVLGGDRRHGHDRRRRRSQRRSDRPVPRARRGAPPTRTCVRCSPATRPAARASASRATAAAGSFFGVPDHDAGVRRPAARPVARSPGAFCAGEMGPVGGRELPARLHRQLALF